MSNYKKYPIEQGPITFLSDRKPITLKIEEIIYVESNDSVITVYATSGFNTFIIPLVPPLGQPDSRDKDQTGSPIGLVRRYFTLNT